jgi:hypothetical protein
LGSNIGLRIGVVIVRRGWAEWEGWNLHIFQRSPCSGGRVNVEWHEDFGFWSHTVLLAKSGDNNGWYDSGTKNDENDYGQENSSPSGLKAPSPAHVLFFRSHGSHSQIMGMGYGESIRRGKVV